MSLRRSPHRTPAFLAADRANSVKSTGPRAPEGKLRSGASLKCRFGRLLTGPGQGQRLRLAIDREMCFTRLPLRAFGPANACRPAVP